MKIVCLIPGTAVLDRANVALNSVVTNPSTSPKGTGCRYKLVFSKPTRYIEEMDLIQD